MGLYLNCVEFEKFIKFENFIPIKIVSFVEETKKNKTIKLTCCYLVIAVVSGSCEKVILPAVDYNTE